MKSCRYFPAGVLFFFIFTLSGTPALIVSIWGGSALAANEGVITGGVHTPNEESIEREEPKVNDPYEGFNREMFKHNDRLYFYVLKPIATVYSRYLPPGARAAVRNGFHNFKFPERFINSFLQGKAERAGTEAVRFLINSTLGVAGLFDVAEVNFSIHGHDADFGQTLALWGTGSGPFLMIPILGPSNPRDLFGYAVDSVMDPLFWIPAEIWIDPAVKAGKVTNNASLRIGEYEGLKKSALDPYISLRDASIQYREHQIRK
jgi:phospholipid-binding lipoprotein MlaA